jgi:hypothetical protein
MGLLSILCFSAFPASAAAIEPPHNYNCSTLSNVKKQLLCQTKIESPKEESALHNSREIEDAERGESSRELQHCMRQVYESK